MEQQIYCAHEIFDKRISDYSLENYYGSDMSPYKHMSIDDDLPAGTEALANALAEIQELDMTDETTAFVLRRHCAFFIRIIQFYFNPKTEEDWNNALMELWETGYILDEKRNGYIQAYYHYLLAHPNIERWDYLDQYKNYGAHWNLENITLAISVHPNILTELVKQS